MDKMNKPAVVVLHEIYGVNAFMEGVCRRLESAGFHVVCPNLLKRPPFAYGEAEAAYSHFMEHVGFDAYLEINAVIARLKERYGGVILLGFSVGATLAWRCCEHPDCDGIVACYGSRIRDYPDLIPACPSLLLFANEDSFDVGALASKLWGKPHVEIRRYAARHGFLDPFSENYGERAANEAERVIAGFLSKWI